MSIWYLNFLICLSHINCFLAFLDKISLFFKVNLFYCKPWRPGSRTPDLNKHEASQKATVPSSVIPKKLEMWRNLLSAYIWLFTTKKTFWCRLFFVPAWFQQIWFFSGAILSEAWLCKKNVLAKVMKFFWRDSPALNIPSHEHSVEFWSVDSTLDSWF